MSNQRQIRRRAFLGASAIGLGHVAGVGSVGADDGETRSGTDTDSADSQEFAEEVEAYANQVGRIATDGLNEAFEDWGNGDITTEVLEDAIDAWSEGERVVEYEIRELDDIEEETTLERSPDGEPVVYQATSDVDVEARLEIEPGVGIEFEQGVELDVDDSDAPIVAQGTEEEPILFTGTRPLRGWWDGIYVEQEHPDNEMDHCIVEYGGNDNDACLDLSSGQFDSSAAMTLTNCTLRRSGKYGLTLWHNATSSSLGSHLRDAENNTYSYNRSGPAQVRSENAHTLDGSAEIFENDNSFVRVSGESMREDGTWDDLGVPYRVVNEVDTDGYDWTIEAGTTIEFEEGADVGVSSGSVIDWQGSPGDGEVNGESEPEWITLTGTQKEPGWWDGVYLDSTSTNNVIEWTIIEYGGGGGENANLAAGSAGTDDEGRTTLRNSILRHSEGYGLRLGIDSVSNVPSRIEDAENNTYSHNGEAPARVMASAADVFDSSAEFDENDLSYVEISSDDLRGDSTWVNLDVPYRSGSVSTSGYDWTIEAGTTIEFEEDAGVTVSEGSEIDWQGSPGEGEVNGEATTATVTETTSGSVDLESPITTDQDSFEVTVTELSVEETANPCLVVFKDDSQQTSFQPVDEGDTETVSATDVDGLEDGVEITATLYEWDCLEGDLASDTTTVREGTDGPIASFTVDPEEPEVGEAVTLDASASSDATTYQWDFENDGEFDQTTSDPVTTTSYEEAGDYEIRLEVLNDAEESDSTTQSLTVSEEADPDWITLTGAQKERGWWDGVYLDSTSTNNVIEWTIIEYGGGDEANLGAGFDGTDDEGRTTLKNSILRHSGSYGLRLGYDAVSNDPSRIEDAQNNTYTENEAGAARVRTDNVHVLSGTSTFSGNEDDHVYVGGTNVRDRHLDSGEDELTWDALDVPYHMSSSEHNIGDGINLTIEPGAEFRFEETSRLQFSGSDTAGILEGTEDDPITFSATEEIPGWWDGIAFSTSESLLNVLDYCIVEYGGRDLEANVDVGGEAGSLEEASLNQLTNCTLRHSAGYGLYVDDSRGSIGTAGVCDTATSGNEFENNDAGDCNV